MVVEDDERRARGRRTVQHPAIGDHQDEFAIIAPWMETIAEGSTLDVLVAPDRPKSWLTLGIHGGEDARRGAGSAGPDGGPGP